MLPAFMLYSCTQEDVPTVAQSAESGIIFRVSLPDVNSRSNDNTESDDLDGGFQVSAICPEDDAATGGVLKPYFTGLAATGIDDMPGYFGMLKDESSELWVWPTTRHGKQGLLRFFAFYPSREALSQSAGVESASDYFELYNSSTKSGSTVKYDYRISKFRVNTDISRHIDFVTATAEGSKKVHGETGIGVNLAFEHQLSRISLKAYGDIANNNSGFANIEIAGVRIGCAVVESDFNFAEKPKNYATGDATLDGNWISPQKKESVEYIFREGDTVIRLDGDRYKTEATAASIMGNGGWAMVIPNDNTPWSYKTDSRNKSNGLYFSVLLRVKGKDKNNTLLYPYVEGAQMSGTTTTDKMNVIYLSVNRTTGKVMKRLYKNGPQFFTDSLYTEVYTAPDTEEIRNYGWAAIPLSNNIRWKPGYQYTYTLNYSSGIGVEDPADLFPGKPIISKILVSVTEGTNTWPMVYDFKNEEEDGVDVTDKITIE